MTQPPPADVTAGRQSGERAAADPYRAIDAQPDPTEFIQRLEARSEARSHARLRRRFLRFARVVRGGAVLEVGSGSGAVARDLARMVGPKGRVVGVDPSRACVVAARRLAHVHGLDGRIAFRVGDGRRLPFRSGRFDVALAVTVLLHVDDPEVVVQEMARVTRPGGVVGLQDQDFGTLALAHPDRELTALILDGVADRLYPEPFSGRRLPGLLRAAGLHRTRLLTDVYQDTTLEPYTQRFLEHRAETAVEFGVVDPTTAQRWLDQITDTARAGHFVLTLNYFGAAGVRP
jgi:ubiquinone/menaquinone biosynthesis C-methylase UbiE